MKRFNPSLAEWKISAKDGFLCVSNEKRDRNAKAAFGSLLTKSCFCISVNAANAASSDIVLCTISDGHAGNAG